MIAPPMSAATPIEGGTFADLGLSEAVLAAVREVGYEQPSPIQRAAIPPLLVVNTSVNGNRTCASLVRSALNSATRQPTQRSCTTCPSRAKRSRSDALSPTRTP